MVAEPARAQRAGAHRAQGRLVALLGVTRGIVTTGIVASGLIGCQIVFGLDEYSEAGDLATGGSGASSGAGASAGSGGGWTETTCLPDVPEAVPGAKGFCRVRRLQGVSTPMRELAPGAYCQGDTCFVYFERRSLDDKEITLECATCNLRTLDCEPSSPVIAEPVENGTVAINPYLRTLPTPQIWLSAVRSGDPAPDDRDIHFAAVNGCTLSPLQALGGPVSSSGHEYYPAVSPNGLVLLFTRCTGGPCRIYIARRATTDVSFGEPAELAGIRTPATLVMSDDIQPQPNWSDSEDSFDALFFSSSRRSIRGANGGDDFDSFVATRARGSAPDAPFESVHLVHQLSGPSFDFAPVPAMAERWLLARRVDGATPSDLFVVDSGCKGYFAAPDDSAFASIDTADDDEQGPSLGPSGDLLFSRSPLGGIATLWRAPPTSGDAFGSAAVLASPDPAHVETASDSSPLLLVDGRLVFASDRADGVSKIWVASEASPPVRATTGHADAWESTPFVDAEGALWLAWGGGSDSAGVIARASTEGGAWGAPVEVEGLAHDSGRQDSSPRLTGDGRGLYFASNRRGGFFAGASSIWFVRRPTPAEAWGTPFLLAELSSVNDAASPWPSADGCTMMIAARQRQAGSLPWSWEITRSGWIAK
jgi:hypothetical protein